MSTLQPEPLESPPTRSRWAVWYSGSWIVRSVSYSAAIGGTVGVT